MRAETRLSLIRLSRRPGFSSPYQWALLLEDLEAPGLGIEGITYMQATTGSRFAPRAEFLSRQIGRQAKRILVCCTDDAPNGPLEPCGGPR